MGKKCVLFSPFSFTFFPSSLSSPFPPFSQQQAWTHTTAWYGTAGCLSFARQFPRGPPVFVTLLLTSWNAGCPSFLPGSWTTFWTRWFSHGCTRRWRHGTQQLTPCQSMHGCTPGCPSWVRLLHSVKPSCLPLLLFLPFSFPPSSFSLLPSPSPFLSFHFPSLLSLFPLPSSPPPLLLPPPPLPLPPSLLSLPSPSLSLPFPLCLLPFPEQRLEMLYAPIRYKLATALNNWHPSDSSAHKILEPWLKVLEDHCHCCVCIVSSLDPFLDFYERGLGTRLWFIFTVFPSSILGTVSFPGLFFMWVD